MREPTRLSRSSNRRPVRLRFESLEDRRLLAAATDVSLHVDLGSGDAMLVFNGSQEIAAYEIASPSGQLVPGSLRDLASQFPAPQGQRMGHAAKIGGGHRGVESNRQLDY